MASLPTSLRSFSSAAPKLFGPVDDATPRLSASLILLNQRHEVLMVQRSTDSRTFAGMHVFPGGNYDAIHDGPPTDLRTTSIRETFEETGILLASPTKSSNPPSPATLREGRMAIHSRTDPTTFDQWLEEQQLTIAESMQRLIPFTQWVTPGGAKARFRTRFYVGFLEEMPTPLVAERTDAAGEDAKPLEGRTETLVPTHDGGVEVKATSFLSPSEILQSFQEGELVLMPPQFYLLTMLNDLLRQEPTAGYIRRMASPAFGDREFNPRFGGKLVEEGVETSILRYEGDSEYDLKAGQTSAGDPKGRHRSVVVFREGRPASIRLERDIDVLGLPAQARL